MRKVNIPKTLKAAVLTGINKPLELRNLEIKDLLPGQVLVKILYSGVCRSQLMEIEGKRGEDNWIPHLLGHEGSGIVIKVGSSVNKFQIGDEVILTWIKCEGLEEQGAEYLSQGEIINSGPVTTFSNYSVVSENRIIKKPKNLGFDTAILFGCALPTGAGMVINEINDNLRKIVKNLGINSARFDKCLNNEVISNKILEGRIDGHQKYSINSTPTIIINEKKFKGSASFKNIKEKIEKLI